MGGRGWHLWACSVDISVSFILGLQMAHLAEPKQLPFFQESDQALSPLSALPDKRHLRLCDGWLLSNHLWYTDLMRAFEAVSEDTQSHTDIPAPMGVSS